MMAPHDSLHTTSPPPISLALFLGVVEVVLLRGVELVRYVICVVWTKIVEVRLLGDLCHFGRRTSILWGTNTMAEMINFQPGIIPTLVVQDESHGKLNIKITKAM